MSVEDLTNRKTEHNERRRRAEKLQGFIRSISQEAVKIRWHLMLCRPTGTDKQLKQMALPFKSCLQILLLHHNTHSLFLTTLLVCHIVAKPINM